MPVRNAFIVTERRVNAGGMMNDSRTPDQSPPQSAATSLVARLSRELPKLASFGVIGVLNGVVNYIVTLGLVWGALIPFGLEGAEWALAAAKGAGWAVAVTNSYVLNTLTTFADESGRKLSLKTYLRFVASGTVGLFAEVASFVVASWYLPLLIAGAVPILVAFTVNFAMTRRFVFPRK
jgi:putative flippase GtrA